MKKKEIVNDDDPLAEDWSEYIGTLHWKKARFIFAPKTTTVTLRMPESMMTHAKMLAKEKGVKYQSMMREAIADYLVKMEKVSKRKAERA